MTRLIFRLVRFANIIPGVIMRRKGLLQAIAGLVALGLGFWGWTVFSPPKSMADHANNFFRTVQLMTLNFPTSFDGKLPWQLQLARLMVPAVAAMATLMALLPAIIAAMHSVRAQLDFEEQERRTEQTAAKLKTVDRRFGAALDAGPPNGDKARHLLIDLNATLAEDLSGWSHVYRHKAPETPG
jgi:hypothetical protein